MKYVYLAGPMSTGGEPGQNLHEAVKTACTLMASGFAVYVPQIAWVLQAISPMPLSTWLEHDRQWLDRCDAVLRLPGVSHGADAEVRRAGKAGKPVFRTIRELIQWEPKAKE